MRLSSTQLEGSAEVRGADLAGGRRGGAPAEARGELARRLEAGSYAPLLALLEWRDDAQNRSSRAALERAHLEAVAGRLNSRLPPHVLLELEALPDDAYLTLVRSPDVFHAAFHGPKHELAACLQRWIEVERARFGAATRLDGTVRAATCDRYVRAEGGRVVSIDELRRLDGGGPGPGPALDEHGELPERLLTRFPERLLVTPSPDELEAARQKLEGAWQRLRARAPLAHRLVHDMIQVVCVRTSLEDPRFSTASDPSTIGVIHVSNAHLPRKLACEVAAELVHEAVHQALFRWELHHPLLADRHVATAKVRSPWTGAVLDVYAFLHACFVWYGVANLWRPGAAPDEPSPAAAGGAPRLASVAPEFAHAVADELADELAIVRQRRVAEAGFAERPLERLGRHRHMLSAELQAAIEEMTEQVAPI